MAFQLPMPCKNISDCFPCNDIPTTNTSSEGADVIQDFAFQWGNPQTNQPPLGSPFSSNGCLFVCASSISQEDAFLCAQRQQVACVTNNWRPTPQDPDVCLNFPCAPTTPPPDEPVPTFGNRVAACSTHCQDGAPYTFTVPAGSFVATNQILADRMASSFACREAVLHKLCLNMVTPFVCQDTEATLVFVATGPFLSPSNNFWELRSGTMPPGFNFTSAMAGPTLSIPGTPTTAGDYTFTIRVTTPNGDFAERPFTVTVDAITTADPLPDAELGTAYSQTLTSTIVDGAWSIVDGELPDGITLASDGTLSGTATEDGDFNFTVQVGDEETACQKEFTLTVAEAGFIDALPDFSLVFDFSDHGFAVGQGNDGFPWSYYNRVSANIDPPLKVYTIVGSGALQACGGPNFASGYEFDDTFTNLSAIGLDESVPEIRKIFENDPGFVEFNQATMNSSGDAAWPGFTTGAEAFGKFYDYALNAFTANIQHANVGTIGTFGTIPAHIGDDGSVLCDVEFGTNAPSFAGQVRTMIWKAGVFTDIHPGTLVTEDGTSGLGWINGSGHAVSVLITAPNIYRPFVNLGGATFSPEGNAVNTINKTGINDSDVVTWDRLGTSQVKTWDSINGVVVLPVVGRLGPPFGGGNVNYRVISNDGVIIGTRAAGGWVFKNGVVHNIIDLLPVGHGWTSIDEGWAISKTGNFVVGKGVLSGVSQFFVAKLSFP